MLHMGKLRHTVHWYIRLDLAVGPALRLFTSCKMELRSSFIRRFSPSEKNGNLSLIFPELELLGTFVRFHTVF